MMILAGVTYFFGIARANGTIDRIIDAVLARIGSNVVVLPFAFFGLTAAISAMGAPVGVFVMAPIGMPLARNHGIDPMLMGIAIAAGGATGAFAPTGLYGIITYGTTQDEVDTFLSQPYAQVKPQVEQGAVASLDGAEFIASVSPPTALSLPWGLDEVVAQLSSAVAARGCRRPPRGQAGRCLENR